MAFSITSSPISVSVSGGGQVLAAFPQQQASTPVSVYGGGIAPPGGLLAASGVSSSESTRSYVLSPEKPPGMIWLSTRMDSGTFGMSVRSSTGYIAVLWWDGTVSPYGSGGSSQFISATRSVLTTGSYARSSPKSVYVWPVSSLNSLSMSGSITGLSCTNKKVTAISADDCGSVATLSCESNDLEYISVSRCTSLSTLSCFGNRLRDIDLTSSTSINSLYIQNNLLKSIDVSRLQQLTSLQCNSNQIESLDLLYNANLTSLFCHSNLLKSLNLNGCKSLTHLNCSGNAIVSVRATGLSFSNPFGANISNNLLDAGGLDQFYADIATSPAGQSPPIFISGNRSTGTVQVASGKGYTVYA